jgi:adenylylsulfate kinase
MSASINQLAHFQKQSVPAVYWVTGLSGAGKTTIATALVADLRRDGYQVVHVDGDTVRKMLGGDLGYSLKDRIANAYRISRLCQYLQKEGLLVVCSTMSLYPEIWEWNRENLGPYYLIYVKVESEILRERDQKGLYSGVELGTCSNVIGVDLPFHEPELADLILENNNMTDQLTNIKKLHSLISENKNEAR